ncbi:glycosyltransferase involved in cell wall biogenesis [Cenarchaeum symbiosum A]|uniref:Glycosyltransferase involved in cell wall biogenesis n=1 Tax=Cenarchaeum symbiosum (strain A) TaxID=414004 RepID=A0RWZ2_CENSY|nr:glycosyltransferase involved in cell wall biogenesis [Cenarchaeum symbiosum A]
MVGTAGLWVFLLWTMASTRGKTPVLGESGKGGAQPRVSIILPARNERDYIGRCLESLIMQDYPDYEIIAVDDSSDDGTGEIIESYAAKDPRVVHVTARPKPEGWMGKNWACMEGYAKAGGDLLLFTDSDTRHDPGVVSMAVAQLMAGGLDALTAAPRMICPEFWTRVTLPMITVFLHTRFSAVRVNDPKKKTGYFFGSFFVIKREAYEAVGTHEGVKQEIIEDGALGSKVKESGRPMRMVMGDHLVDAVWARDPSTLWNALKRLMVPLYLQSPRTGVGAFFAVLFILFMPFALLVYSSMQLAWVPSAVPLFAFSLAASCMAYAGAAIETRVLHLGLRYAAAGPLGGLVVALGFASGLLHAKSSSSVSWRGRSYSMKDHAQGSIRV